MRSAKSHSNAAVELDTVHRFCDPAYAALTLRLRDEGAGYGRGCRSARLAGAERESIRAAHTGDVGGASASPTRTSSPSFLKDRCAREMRGGCCECGARVSRPLRGLRGDACPVIVHKAAASSPEPQPDITPLVPDSSPFPFRLCTSPRSTRGRWTPNREWSPLLHGRAVVVMDFFTSVAAKRYGESPIRSRIAPLWAPSQSRLGSQPWRSM